MDVIVPPTPALASLNELSSTLITWYWCAVVNPLIIVPSAEYTTVSPSSNPCPSKLIVSDIVFIPIGSTINFLLVYPEPPSRTLIALKVLVSLAFLNLWIPCVLALRGTTPVPASKSPTLV